MEKILLDEVNKMAAETKRRFDEYGGYDEVYKTMLHEIHGALRVISKATGKEYVINPDGTVTER